MVWVTERTYQVPSFSVPAPRTPTRPRARRTLPYLTMSTSPEALRGSGADVAAATEASSAPTAPVLAVSRSRSLRRVGTGDVDSGGVRAAGSVGSASSLVLAGMPRVRAGCGRPARTDGPQ